MVKKCGGMDRIYRLRGGGKGSKMSPVELLHKVIENLKPEYEVRPRRVGGATYQVPIEVPPRRQISLAIRWLVEAARKGQGTGVATR